MLSPPPLLGQAALFSAALVVISKTSFIRGHNSSNCRQVESSLYVSAWVCTLGLASQHGDEHSCRPTLRCTISLPATCIPSVFLVEACDICQSDDRSRSYAKRSKRGSKEDNDTTWSTLNSHPRTHALCVHCREARIVAELTFDPPREENGRSGEEEDAVEQARKDVEIRQRVQQARRCRARRRRERDQRREEVDGLCEDVGVVCQVKLIVASTGGTKTRHQLSEEEEHEGRADAHRRCFKDL